MAVEYRLEHDTNYDDKPLARVSFRHDGQRRWQRFVVVLDGDTTYETVAQNVETIIAEYERIDRSAEALEPDPYYSCGAAYCDDPACTTHNPRHPNHGES